MRAYFVYMVRCSDDSFYIGVTNDVDRRVGEHNFGLDPNCYTYSRRPVSLVYSTLPFLDPLSAIAWEKQIKKWTRRKKQALVDGDYDSLKRFARTGSNITLKYRKK